VKVPTRIVLCPSYPDIALATYVKIRALGMRPEGCQARVTTIAAYLGVSAASVGRGLKALSTPAADGVVEIRTDRRTLPGGRGLSAVRRARPMSRAEPFVWLPVAAAEDLTARQLRVYALISYAQARGAPLTESELAGSLVHHSGKRARQTLSVTAAGLIVDELSAARWVTVMRRAGARGRHQYIAHDLRTDAPVASVGAECSAVGAASSGAAAEPLQGLASSQSDEETGPQSGAGSLANRELLSTDSPENAGASFSSAVGEIPVPIGAGAVEISDEIATEIGLTDWPAPSADAGTNAGAEVSPRKQQIETRGPKAGGTHRRYTGPQLLLSPRVYAVLKPVHGLLSQVNNDFVTRQIAREAGRQLRAGTSDERLHHRLTARLAGTMTDEIRDPGRWILGAALPRWGCGLEDCESGTLWTSGRACEVCAEAVHDKYLARRRTMRLQRGLCPKHGTCRGPADRCVDCELEFAICHPVPAQARVSWGSEGPPRGSCGECGARIMLIGNALDDGLCKPCRTSGTAAVVLAESPSVQASPAGPPRSGAWGVG
jgi:hypothetical protein